MAQVSNINVGLNLESAAFISGADKARLSFVRNLDSINAASAKSAAAIGGVTKSTQSLVSANDNIKRFGNFAQQAGYQVGDFAVQVASGGSALTAFIQQGSQIAGAFGPIGAAVGAVGAVVGALATHFLNAGDAAEQMGRQVAGAVDSIQRLEKAEAERAATAREQRAFGGLGAPGGASGPGGVIDPNQLALAARARRGPSQLSLYPSASEEQRLKEYLEFQKPLLEGIAAAEKKLADTRDAAATKAASQAKTTQDTLERRNEAAAKTLEQAEFEAESAERLAAANDESAEAYKRVQVEIEREQTILSKSAGLKEQEIAQLREFAEAEEKAKQRILETNEAREAQEKLVAANIAFMDRIAADADRLKQQTAEQQADIYAQPFKDLATSLSNTLSSGIQDALSGEFDFTTFAEGFGDIFADTLAASITAALTPALTKAAESFGDVMTSAISTAAGGGGTAGAPGAGLSYGGAALGGAAAGGIAGGLYGAYAPGMKPGNYAGVGGAIGGGIGAAAGMYFGPWGALAGGALGSAAGSAIGGLFGGQNNLGNDRSAQQFRAGRGATYSDASFSAENRQVTQGIIDQLTSLQDALETAGGAIADFGLRLEAGNKSGITVNGKKYPNAQAALAASLEVLIGSTTGLSASQQTVLQTTKAKDAQGIAADLDFAAQFDAMTFTGTALEAALKALDGQMQQFARRAGELGLSVDAVAAAHQREAQALVDAQTAQQNQIKSAIQAIAPAGDQLELQLAQLNDGVQELARQATAAGLPLDDLAAAHQRAAANLVAANEQLKTSLLSQIEALAPAGNTLAIQLAQLNDRVQELARAATAAGLPLEQLAAAHQRAADQLAAAAAQAQAAVNLQVASLNPATNPLDLQLRQLQAQVDSLKPALDATGQTYDELAKAHQAAAAKIVADYHATQRAEAEAAKTQREAAAKAAAQAREDAREAQRQAALTGRTIQAQIAQAGGDKSLATQLYILTNEMQALQAAAAAAGIPLSEVTKAHKLAAAELQRVAALTGRSVQLQIAQAGGDKSLGTQLYALQIQMEELAKAASTVGIPLSEVTKAHKLAGAELARQAALAGRSVQLQIAQFGGDTSLGTQLYGLQIQMEELAKAAADVGIPLSEVTAAHTKAAAAIREEFAARKRALLAQVDELGQFGTPLQRSLGALQSQVEQLARELTAAGLPIDKLAEAHKKAAQRIRDDWEETLRDMRRQQRELTQGILEAQRSSAGAIDSFLNPFKEALSSRGIGQGVYSGASLTESGLKEFRETLREARTGDTGALSSLVGIGQGAIAQARETYGSTTAFANIFREIEAGLREQRDVLEDKREELLTQIGTFTRETVDEIIKLRVQAIGDLRADFAKLSRDLVVAVEGNS